MKNKELKKSIPVELNDDTLNEVSGGLLKPIILNETDTQIFGSILNQNGLINGVYD